MPAFVSGVGVSRHQRFSNSVEKPEVRAGIFGAGERMRRHEMHAGGHMRRDLRDDRALDRADIGENGAALQIGRAGARHRANGADGNAKDDEIGARERAPQVAAGVVSYAEFAHARENLRRGVIGGDFHRGAPGASGARDRRADQAEADQAELLEQRRGVAHPRPMNSVRAATTRSLASREPTVSRKNSGMP